MQNLRITVCGKPYEVWVNAYLNEPWAQPWELSACPIPDDLAGRRVPTHTRAGGPDFNTALEKLASRIRKNLKA